MSSVNQSLGSSRPMQPRVGLAGYSAQTGVTLIELIVVVVIVGILAAIAMPSYRQYVIRSQRADATTALMRVSTAQEKFYLDNNAYASSLASLNITGTERGFYTLTTSCSAAGCATGFNATAIPVGTGPQSADKDCGRFATNDRSERFACKTSSVCAPGDANDTTQTCWK
jgi:type IV pilus assembly protein PilE